MTGPDPTSPAHGRRRRPTPPSAFGEPSVWMMGSALITCLALVAVIIVLIMGEGLTTLWPRPIERVTLHSGETFLALPMGSERFTPGEAETARMAELRGEIPPEKLEPVRVRFRLGNRDIGRAPFRWVPVYEIASRDRPEHAVLLERDEWGIFIGLPEAVRLREEFIEPASTPLRDSLELQTGHGPGVATQRVIEDAPAGMRRVARETRIASGPEGTLEIIRNLLPEATDRRQEIERLLREEIPALQDRLAQLRWRERRAEMAHRESHEPASPVWLWALSAFGGVGAIAAAGALVRLRPPSTSRAAALTLLAVVAGLAGLHAVLERPFARGGMTDAEYAAVVAEIAESRAALEQDREALLARIRLLERADARVRVEIVDPGLDRFAPVAQAQPDEPMRLSQALRIVESNTLGFWGRFRIYLARWGDFLSRPPGESPGEGGVFPVIIGTVVLTLLLTVSVLPLGVIAAIYLREYAHQGVVTSAIRIAINNLAGVPSIVYGMFGLGFFCYTLGGYIDAGPRSPLPTVDWWTLAAALGAVVLLAGLLTLASSGPGVAAGRRSRLSRIARIAAWWVWLGVVALAAYLLWTTPYFDGFFRAKLPEQPTFGARGILWAALTLALLTLPVVIVATEEAIAAVPNSMRQGSLGCGASRWQTVRRIILPASMPGVLTGAILAMARGAGEVAPLMLVGAVNLAPALPVSGEPPYLHGDRTFMHLGFHIYNLGFQSPDAEAARPLVWTTTLLLVAIVLLLNLAAMIIRARLPGRAGGGGL